jgi:hypothetical protein
MTSIKYIGMDVHKESISIAVMLRELRRLREENRKLKGIVADLTLDRHILQEVLSKKA